jgi:hypothetical protein
VLKPADTASQEMLERLAQPPAGFAVREVSAERITIAYRATGMGCLLGLLSVFCGVGIVVIVAAFLILLLGRGFPGTFYVLHQAIFLGGLVRLSCTLLFRRFGTTELSMTTSTMEISRHIFGFSRSTSVPLAELRFLKQTQDGGTSITLFESWGLCLIGKHAYWHLLSRERREQSDWLGYVLAGLLGLEYRRAKYWADAVDGRQ